MIAAIPVLWYFGNLPVQNLRITSQTFEIQNKINCHGIYVDEGKKEMCFYSSFSRRGQVTLFHVAEHCDVDYCLKRGCGGQCNIPLGCQLHPLLILYSHESQ